jgi:hypothetical protein
MNICLLIITKNELKNIMLVHDTMVKVCQHCKINYVYIDGDSNDGSKLFFELVKAPYIKQKYKGRGGAIRTGFESMPADAFVIFSPDGNENITDVPKMIRELKLGADLVIASRMMKGAFNEEDYQFFRPRKIANKIFNYFANLFFNKKVFITDSINGFRCISRKALNKIKLTSFDYTIEYQMTIKAMKLNLTIKEFPTLEGQRIFGKTGAPSISTGIAFIKRLAIELINN